MLVGQGDPQSLWPSISYKVIPGNLFLETSFETGTFINFLASREPHMNRSHLQYYEDGPQNMRECTWQKVYTSILTGTDLQHYKYILEQPWSRIAVAHTISDKWDSFWEARDDVRSGTLIFARSANSHVLCEVDVRFSEDYFTMYTERLRVTIESSSDDEEFDKRMANWLIMTKFWNIPFYPFPSSCDFRESDGLAEFLLAGSLGSVIISNSEPDIIETYTVIRRAQQLAHIPYIKMLMEKNAITC